MFDLESKTCYIVPNSMKKRILLNMSKNKIIMNVKFCTLKEILEKIELRYDKRALYYLMSKHNMNYENSLMYLNSLKFISNAKYNIEKLDYLVKLKEELIKENLIDEKIDIGSLKGYKIKIYNAKYLDKYYINLLNKYFDVDFVNNPVKKNKVDIFKFDTKEKEISFVFDKIKELLSENVDINKIKIVNYSDVYCTSLKRISRFYNIPLSIPSTTYLYSINSIKLFYKKLYNVRNKNQALEYLKGICKNKNLINQVISILNDYYFIDNLDWVALECIKNDLKSIKIFNDIVKNCVEIKDIEDVEEDDYVFLINFNEGEIPKNIKDIDYITDDLNRILGKDEVLDKNIKDRDKLLSKINSIENLFITYKEMDSFNSYLVSPLIYKLDYNLYDRYEYNYTSSHDNNVMNMCIKLDNLIKYGLKDESLDILYTNYKDLEYRTYDNSFKGLDKYKLFKYLNNKLTLSYTSLELYNECGFKYYINNILKINDIDIPFKTKIGSIFHDILSKMYLKEFDYSLEYDKKIDEFKTNKDRFFFKYLKGELEYIVSSINKQEENMDLDEVITEKEISVNYKDDINITFVGKIDKIRYKKIDNSYLVALIDYKTGSPDTSLNNINYGLNMQLPIYLFLINRSNDFKNIIPIGIYYQKILNNKLNNPKDYDKERYNQLKLEGYSNSNVDYLKYFDKYYSNSSMIKSMKVGEKGFYAYSKIMSEDDFKKLDEIVSMNIGKAIKSIKEANFSINPKKDNLKNISCEYCKYKDICFRKEKDFIYLTTMPLKEVLKGEKYE